MAKTLGRDMGEVVKMKYVEIDYEYVHQTPEAVLISDGDKEHWIPKSCIEDVDYINLEKDTTMCVIEWYAISEGLI